MSFRRLEVINSNQLQPLPPYPKTIAPAIERPRFCALQQSLYSLIQTYLSLHASDSKISQRIRNANADIQIAAHRYEMPGCELQGTKIENQTLETIWTQKIIGSVNTHPDKFLDPIYQKMRQVVNRVRKLSRSLEPRGVQRQRPEQSALLKNMADVLVRSWSEMRSFPELITNLRSIHRSTTFSSDIQMKPNLIANVLLAIGDAAGAFSGYYLAGKNVKVLKCAEGVAAAKQENVQKQAREAIENYLSILPPGFDRDEVDQLLKLNTLEASFNAIYQSEKLVKTAGKFKPSSSWAQLLWAANAIQVESFSRARVAFSNLQRLCNKQMQLMQKLATGSKPKDPQLANYLESACETMGQKLRLYYLELESVQGKNISLVEKEKQKITPGLQDKMLRLYHFNSRAIEILQSCDANFLDRIKKAATALEAELKRCDTIVILQFRASLVKGSGNGG